VLLRALIFKSLELCVDPQKTRFGGFFHVRGKGLVFLSCLERLQLSKVDVLQGSDAA
jgi:hypothetical protein